MFARTVLRASRFAAAPRVAPRFIARGFAASTRVNEVIKKYTKAHEWISLDTADGSNTATIGITAYAAASLGDVVYVELPSVAAEAVAGETFGAVESVKSASDILSPVNGEVVEVNEALNEKPSLINASPEENGWVAKVKIAGPEVLEAEGLLEEENYKAFIEKA
ncbi:glycine cleavage H-protein-domain-containing protein [Sphaerosporella brunnea]|uniref:Glycine cleavage system H protein n=1 Tax=Sphaerosporella brunnea TaxID=1250544 RepID=A0A5J5FC09_9PEZI|nr:glycine cleavage H-protein-domain-containing protein [Sphaerosporella brunnea]